MGKTTDYNKQDQRSIFFRLISYTSPHYKMIILAFILLSLATLGEIIGPILIKIFI